jgi:hypothetical protein
MPSSDIRALVQAFARRLEQEVRADIRAQATAALTRDDPRRAKAARRAPTKPALARSRRLQANISAISELCGGLSANGSRLPIGMGLPRRSHWRSVFGAETPDRAASSGGRS